MEKERSNLWLELLECCQTSNDSIFSRETVLILGENPFSLGLVTKSDQDFGYSFVKNDENVQPGESVSLNVWTFRNSFLNQVFLKHALNNQTLTHSVILLCASMAEPWNLLDTLESFAKLIESYLKSPEIDFSLFETCQKKELKYWQNYGFSSNTFYSTKRNLDKSILTKNLGVPIIVAVTDCGQMSGLKKDFSYSQEHFDFIQENLRWFCLKYGAALVYINEKEKLNKEMLYKYIMHRVGGNLSFDFVRFTGKDSIFIPAGWDNEKNISILSESYTTVDRLDDFNDHIIKPVKSEFPRHVPLEMAENDQEFLSKMMPLLAEEPLKSQRSPLTTVIQTAVRESAVTESNQQRLIATYFNNLTEKNNSAAKLLKKDLKDNNSIDEQLELFLGASAV